MSTGVFIFIAVTPSAAIVIVAPQPVSFLLFLALRSDSNYIGP